MPRPRPSNPSAFGSTLRLTVLRLPHMSRNTDFEPLLADARVSVHFAGLGGHWGEPDAILLPGGSHTADDMAIMRRRGAARRLQEFVASGGTVMGICGGYQMLGHSLSDPQGVDGGTKAVRGLGLLPIETEFVPEKLICNTTVRCLLPELAGALLHGREGRYGRSVVQAHDGSYQELHAIVERTGRSLRAEDGLQDGLVRADRRVWGTYLHRIFENELWNAMFFEFLLRRRARR